MQSRAVFRSLAIAAVLMIALAHPAHASPSGHGDFLIGPKIVYAENPGVGLMAAYDVKAHGVTFIAELAAAPVDGVSGTVEAPHGYLEADDRLRAVSLLEHRTREIPYSTGQRTVGQVSVGVLFRLSKL